MALSAIGHPARTTGLARRPRRSMAPGMSCTRLKTDCHTNRILSATVTRGEQTQEQSRMKQLLHRISDARARNTPRTDSMLVPSGTPTRPDDRFLINSSNNSYSIQSQRLVPLVLIKDLISSAVESFSTNMMHRSI